MEARTELQEESLVGVLSDDAQAAFDDAMAEMSVRSYRTAVRTVFAAMEALVWHMKDLMLKVCDKYPDSYSSLELAALRDEAYFVANNGVVKSKSNFIPVSTSLRLIEHLIKRIETIRYEPSLSRKALALLESSVVVRNRLTHPKAATDFAVTKTDVEDAILSYASVQGFAVQVLSEAEAHLALHAGEAVESIRARTVPLHPQTRNVQEAVERRR